MVRSVFRVYILMLVAMTFVLAKNPQLPWGTPGIPSIPSVPGIPGIPGIKLTTSTETINGVPPTTRRTCPEPTDELRACIRQWDCQELLRLDLRCLLNLNGLPLVGNLLGGVLGGLGGQSPTQPPALGTQGGGLLGGPGGILGSLLG
ncbi:uncharacterized protein LOC118746447 [Rhagoletis pomonella]|uniref:uncharacterized protein LOC118746447 n=1 Tax=Rhagoletis pomonella TaxID=28610 RepID=UPI0017856177|nr:uncharacterized protein LOC118746447 [Rhagoletis pomonella]